MAKTAVIEVVLVVEALIDQPCMTQFAPSVEWTVKCLLNLTVEKKYSVVSVLSLMVVESQETPEASVTPEALVIPEDLVTPEDLETPEDPDVLRGEIT